MPRQRNSPPSLRRHKPSGRGVVTLNGHDHYVGPWPSGRKKPPPETQTAYDRLIAEWLARGRGLAVPSASTDGITVGELIVAFWEHAETHYRRADGTHTTEVNEYRRSLQPVRELYAETPAADFGPLRFKAVRERLVAAGLCRGVVNQRLGRVRRMFKWGVAEEFVPASVLQALQAVPGLQKGRTGARETEPVEPVPQEHIDAILGLVLPQIRDLIRLQFLTGCRPGEVVLIRPRDLERRADVWLYRPAHHKTAHHGHERLIFLGPQAQEVVRPYLLDRPADAYLFSPAEAKAAWNAERRARRKTRVQPGQQSRARVNPKKQPGQRYSTGSYARAIAKACIKANVPRWHPHQLRHNAATRIVGEHGWDAARIILGHRTLQATRIYGEDNVRKAAEVMARLG